MSTGFLTWWRKAKRNVTTCYGGHVPVTERVDLRRLLNAKPRKKFANEVTTTVSKNFCREQDTYYTDTAIENLFCLNVAHSELKKSKAFSQDERDMLVTGSRGIRGS